MGAFLNPEWLTPAVLKRVQATKAVAAKAGLTLSQFALAWVLRQPNVAAAIAGASRPEQVDDNAAAAGVEVAPELFTEAEALLPG
jgi:aryl-alcohol dehydrogenase-like predicted oxidoreductase